MTNPTFFVATDSTGAAFILYGDPDDQRPGRYDVVVSRVLLDRQNEMLWRPVVAKLTGEWPDCDDPICHWDDRRHEGPCRTHLAPGGGAA